MYKVQVKCFVLTFQGRIAEGSLEWRSLGEETTVEAAKALSSELSTVYKDVRIIDSEEKVVN